MTVIVRLATAFTFIVLFTHSSVAFAAITYASFESDWSGFVNNGTEDFLRRSGTTPSSSTGPIGAADGTTYYAYLETSNGAAYSNGDTAYLEASDVTSGSMSFFYHMYGSDTGTLAVEVYANGAWQRLWEVTGQQHSGLTAPWTKQYISLAFYPGTKKIRFVAIAAGGYRGDMAIDEVRFDAATSTTLNYEYDALGRVVCVEDGVNGDRDYVYDDAGNRTQVSVGNCSN